MFVAVSDCIDMCLCGLLVMYCVLLSVLVLLLRMCVCLNVFVYVVCDVLCDVVPLGCCCLSGLCLCVCVWFFCVERCSCVC